MNPKMELTLQDTYRMNAAVERAAENGKSEQGAMQSLHSLT
jgi:hypothetical protein